MQRFACTLICALLLAMAASARGQETPADDWDEAIPYPAFAPVTWEEAFRDDEPGFHWQPDSSLADWDASLNDEQFWPLPEIEAAENSASPAGVRKPFGGGLGGPGGGGAPGSSAAWYPAQGVAGQASELSLLRQRLTLGAPVWNSEGRTVILSLSVRGSHYSTTAVLPDTGEPFPEKLWNINLGLNYLHTFDNGWKGMLMLGFGSASDEPFHSLDEMNGNLGGFVTMPARNQRDAWNLGVMYSPAGTLNFPIPIIGYVLNYSDDFQMNIGVPFSLNWRPAADWTVTLAYVPLTNGSVRLTYQAAETVQFFAAYESLSEAYFLADRVNVSDRFFVIEQRLVGGLRWSFHKHLALCANAGYAFGREFGEGENQGDELYNRLSVEPGPFVGLDLQLQF